MIKIFRNRSILCKKYLISYRKVCMLDFFCIFRTFFARRDARVVEEARLESVYTPKVYRGFESRFLRSNSVLEELLLTNTISKKRIINLKRSSQ